MGRRSRVFVFWDSGYFMNKQDSEINHLYKSGYGMGFRLETGLGIMSVDYGLGEGDDLMSGKLHFGLINEF